VNDDLERAGERGGSEATSPTNGLHLSSSGKNENNVDGGTRSRTKVFLKLPSPASADA
jgi:hypothetical protein